jgi:hypothetical protein
MDACFFGRCGRNPATIKLGSSLLCKLTERRGFTAGKTICAGMQLVETELNLGVDGCSRLVSEWLVQ